MNKYIRFGLLCFFFVTGCSDTLLPVDDELRRAIWTSIHAKRDSDYPDPLMSYQDSILFVGIEFNHKANPDSVLISIEYAPTFFFMDSVYYVGTWKSKDLWITVANSIPQNQSFKEHINIDAFDPSLDSYNRLWADEFPDSRTMCFDGELFRAYGKYINNQLFINTMGWFHVNDLCD